MLIHELDTLIKQHHHLIIAIDGKCGGGKTTLANQLKNRYQANVIHMDDFFLQPYQRNNKRYKKPGENIDHERFLKQVLIPLSKRQDVSYQRFDCTSLTLGAMNKISYKPITIIEGTYCMHPNLISYYDYLIFVDIDDESQIVNLKKRSPHQLAMFIEKWIPLENIYFDYYQLKNKINYLYIYQKEE